MIYTVTLNPSIDFTVFVDNFKQGQLNRMKKDKKFPGGKGINVSRVLKELDIPSVALGFVGGFTGDFIKKELESQEIHTDFVEVSQDTRINIKLKAQEESEINGLGPELTKEQVDELLGKFQQMTQEDFVVLSGSKPRTLAPNFYQQIIELLVERKVPFVIDTEGKELYQSLASKPFLVKPNIHELEDLFQEKTGSIEEVVNLGRKLIEAGAENAIVSMGGQGSLLLTKDGVYRAKAPQGKVINTVGSGDSMVAAFLGRYHQKKDLVEAFQYANAAGSATAFSEDLTSLEEIHYLLNKIKIEKL